jgi:radical SAM protein with 4Fe4S-binding SPASM domain
MRTRAEPFGAWVRVGDGTLLAVTRPAARRLGVSGGALWSDGADALGPRPPLEVHVAVTSRCGAGCTGCYVDARPDGEVPPLSVIVTRLRAIAESGVFTVAFGGGEPLSRPDLGELAEAARALGLTPVVTTSGIGMTRERAFSLQSFAQVNVSYDGEAGDYARVRGFDGAKIAERAMDLLKEADVPFGVNVVLTRATFASLERTVARAEALGALEAQLLRYKPAGRARSAEYLATRLSPAQVEGLLPALSRIASARAIALRIDCALLPFLSAHRIDPATLARFGVFGCEASRHLAAVRVDGAVAPCSFGPSAEVDVVSAFREAGGWGESATLQAWRTPPEAEPCRSCPIHAACRGGCRVVAAHLTGELGPDPECPRVAAHRAGVEEREDAEA